MDEREAIIAKTTEIASKEAKKQKMNEAQTKLYIETEVQKAVAEFDEKVKNANTVIPTQTNAENEDTKKEQKVVSEVQKEQKTEVKKVTNVKKFIVHTPVGNFCGEVAGVQFAYGKAEVKPGWILNWFKEHGYKVEEVSE